MTKTYEEVVRGPLGDLVTWANHNVRGEITVVVAGASPDEVRAASGLIDASGWVGAVREREAAGLDRRVAIAEVAKLAGIPRRDVYDAVVLAKATQP